MGINGLLLQQAGQGDAYILPAFDSSQIADRLDRIENIKAAKAAASTKAKQDRDKRLDELMKWTPEQAWYPHTEQANAAVKDVYNYMTDMRKQDREPSADEINTLNQKKWAAETLAKKSQDIKTLYPQLRQDISGMDKYTNKEYLQSRLNDEIFGDEGNKDVNAIDFNKLGNITSDPKAFNAQSWTEDFAKSLPENVDSMIGTMQAAGGDLITDKEVKSKFFDLDASGNVRYENGKPVIKVTDETVNLAIQEPRFNAYIQDQLSKPENKYKTAKDIVTTMLTPYASRQEKLNVSKGFSDTEKEGVSVTTSYDQTRNFNLAGKIKGAPDKKIEGAWVPEVKSLYDKKDKKVRFESPVFIDANTNKVIENVGNKELNGIELQLRAYDPETGKLIIGNQKDVTSNPKYLYKWYVSGSYSEGTGAHAKVKQVLMPYEDVKPQMKAAYGVDLDSRDPSELTDLELISYIKKTYPQSSGEERHQIFNSVRNPE